MLFFIRMTEKEAIEVLHLNTSHVIFYPDDPLKIKSIKPFKYISCYFLSAAYQRHKLYTCEFKYISCYFLSNAYNNDNIEIQIFKYISCYFLSPCLKFPTFEFFLFKYISCYFLSWVQRHHPTCGKI